MYRSPTLIDSAKMRGRVMGYEIMRDYFTKLLTRLQRQAEHANETAKRASPRNSWPRCGARTRAGSACAAPAVWDPELNLPRNGRCRMHGGLSTGPRTAEGKRRSLAAIGH